jgi:hypothetical protein
MGGNMDTESTKARNTALPRMGSFASEKAASEPTKRERTVDEVATTVLLEYGHIVLGGRGRGQKRREPCKVHPGF